MFEYKTQVLRHFQKTCSNPMCGKSYWITDDYTDLDFCPECRELFHTLQQISHTVGDQHRTRRGGRKKKCQQAQKL